MPFKEKDTTFMARSLPKLLYFVQKNSPIEQKCNIGNFAVKCWLYDPNMQPLNDCFQSNNGLNVLQVERFFQHIAVYAAKENMGDFSFGRHDHSIR